ncbi:MAG: O-antigen ligase family protein [Patescibacteria group bacterium]|nr:O-antigen ligase family protein [Patescibacteria group bacterium]
MITQKIITYSFYLLFLATPLIWLPYTSELFEYNKMMFIYLLTIVITTTWLIKMIQLKKVNFKKTILDLPLLLFLLANILSTIFSIDVHTSIWGYYSRSNGGLLSILAYLLLYWALVSNTSASQAFKYIKALIISGLLVALWAIPEHFGGSPSCLLLRGELNASCWVQDVQARVFATLGQPNWLAAYLAMIAFPIFYFLLTTTNKLAKILYGVSLVLVYLAFTFTYSRGGLLGLVAGLIVLLAALLWSKIKQVKTGSLKLLKIMGVILGAFILVNLLFGSALTDFKLITPYAPPPRPSLATGSTQLESGGDETGQIRLIVWQGALDIFKAYPIFGSGVETFAYSYYQFRPVEHNLTSEWDFLYNKAHNEYLNYLSTTGIVGFATYLAVILVFIIWSLKKIYHLEYKSDQIDSNNNQKNLLLLTSFLAADVSYLVQNFFSFSVVIIALYFYIFPGLVFTALDQTKQFKIPAKLNFLSHILAVTIYRKDIFTKLVLATLIIFASYLIISLEKFHQADELYAASQVENNSGNAGQAYNDLADAVRLNFNEPIYHSELGYASAEAAAALYQADATQSAQLKNQAVLEATFATYLSPRNLSIYRTNIRTYYLLSTIDSAFNQTTLDTLNKAISYAPTDAKLVYNKGLIQLFMHDQLGAVTTFKQAIYLKPNYKEAVLALGQILDQEGQTIKAKQIYQNYLNYVPNDVDILQQLESSQSASKAGSP